MGWRLITFVAVRNFFWKLLAILLFHSVWWKGVYVNCSMKCFFCNFELLGKNSSVAAFPVRLWHMRFIRFKNWAVLILKLGSSPLSDFKWHQIHLPNEPFFSAPWMEKFKKSTERNLPCVNRKIILVIATKPWRDKTDLRCSAIIYKGSLVLLQIFFP